MEAFSVQALNDIGEENKEEESAEVVQEVWPEEIDVEPIEIQQLLFSTTTADNNNNGSSQCTLFLGAYTSLRHLTDYRISSVLNVANEIPPMEESERASAKVTSYSKLLYPGIFDRAKERNAFFNRCYHFIAQSACNADARKEERKEPEGEENDYSHNALVHCKFGLNRCVFDVSLSSISFFFPFFFLPYY
jgi:hypothetical protein